MDKVSDKSLTDLIVPKQQKLKLSEIRAQFPMYEDLSNDQLLIALRNKFYPDIPKEKFYSRIDYDTERQDATQGQSFGENVRQGIGAGMSSAVRALGGGSLLDKVGLPGSKEEAETLDRSLDNTVGGKVGRVVGLAAPAALAVPFTPATLAGGVGAGALTGAALTEGGAGDRAVGAALGGAGSAVAGALPAVYRAGKGAVKGIIEPFTDAGRDRIAGRAIQRFATDQNALRNLTNQPTATGAQLTLAEAARDPGLATLQRAVATMTPDAAAPFEARAAANNAARINALQKIAGDPTRRAAAESARDATAGTLYKTADDAVVNLDGTFTSLMQRPAFAGAVKNAESLAKNEGLADLFFRGPDGAPIAMTGQGAHYIKKALDDAADRASATYMGDAAAKSAGKTQQAFLGWLEKSVPEYGAARQTFADMSRPLNRMDVGQRLLDKTTASMRDLGGNQKLQANAFSKALNDEEGLIRAATDQRGRGLSDVMNPDELNALSAIRNELETVANLGQAANGPGSQTAKMLASQNLLRQIAGPLGLPDSFASSVIGQTAMRPVQFGLQAAEPRIGAAIADAMLDPAQAQRLIQAAAQYDAISAPNALLRLARRSVPASLGAGSAYLAGQ